MHFAVVNIRPWHFLTGVRQALQAFCTTLTWDAKDGADGYVISIRGKGDKAFRRLDRVTDKSAVLSDLKPGTYTVYVRYEKDGKLAKCRQSARTIIEIG